jgi:hypothetical protein
MAKSGAEREKEGRMTRKFLTTVAIVAIALAPSIGIGPAQAHGFGGGLAAAASTVAGLAATVFMVGMAAVFTADTAVVSTAGVAAAFTVGMVATIRAIMDMAIPHTVTTATDRVQLAAWNGAGLERSQSSAGWAGALDFQCPTFSSSCWSRTPQRGDAGLS